MKSIAAYVAETIHQVLTHPRPAVVMLIETDVYPYHIYYI